MPAIGNSFKTYDAKGNREDLSDAIYNIDPFDTPLISALGRRNVSNVTYDWQVENLKAVDPDNAEVEGFELSRSPAQPTVRQSNVAQISKKDATVSGTQNAADAAGKRKEMAHQMALRSTELKRDMETIASGVQPRQNGDAATARKTRAFEAWLSTNALRGATGADAASETAAPTDGTARPFTEDLLKEALASCWDSGARPTLLFVGSHNKQIASTFVGRENSRQSVDSNRVEASVTIYDGDFGTLKILPSHWTRARSALLVDPNYARIAYYRNFQQKPLATIGDAETRMILAEWGVQVDNEAAHAVIADLTVA